MKFFDDFRSFESVKTTPAVLWFVIAVVVVLIFAVGAAFVFPFLGTSLQTTGEKASRFLDRIAGPEKTFFRYTIQGVPAVTVYNHTGDNAYIITAESAAIKSILGFYGEELSTAQIADLNTPFYDPADIGALRDMETVIRTVRSVGFEVEKVALPTVADLARFINDEKQNPLIFFQPLVVAQPRELKFIPPRVLIGVDEKEEQVIVHDYYRGYNLPMSFAEFNTLWLDMSPEYRNIYLAIQPKNDAYKATPREPYRERSSQMNKAEPVINTITLARVAAATGLWDLQFSLSEEAVSSRNFEKDVPPYYKIVAYALLADKYLFSRPVNIGGAEQLTDKAEMINADLDKSFGDFWPGFVDRTNKVHNVSDGPFYMRGLMSRYAGQYDQAIQSFNKALAVWPYGEYTKRQLEITEDLREKARSLASAKQQVTDAALKNILVQKSPWSVSWTALGRDFTQKGTQKMSFTLGNNGTFSGRIFDAVPEAGPASMERIFVKDGCMRFVSGVTGTIYEYCLAKGGTLRGAMMGTTPQIRFFVGDAVARPAVR